MDVHCTTCNEPWDTYYLWHDAIFETALPAEEARAWGGLPKSLKLSHEYRQEFIAVGFYFGRSVINVIRCPACPDGAKPDPDRLATKAALEELMGDDEDGLAATFEDHNL